MPEAIYRRTCALELFAKRAEANALDAEAQAPLDEMAAILDG